MIITKIERYQSFEAKDTTGLGQVFHESEARNALYSSIAKPFESNVNRLLLRLPQHGNAAEFTALAVEL